MRGLFLFLALSPLFKKLGELSPLLGKVVVTVAGTGRGKRQLSCQNRDISSYVRMITPLNCMKCELKQCSIFPEGHAPRSPPVLGLTLTLLKIIFLHSCTYLYMYMYVYTVHRYIVVVSVLLLCGLAAVLQSVYYVELKA